MTGTEASITIRRRDVPAHMEGFTRRWFPYKGKPYGVVYNAGLGYEIIDEKGVRVAGDYPSQDDLREDAARAIDEYRSGQ